jgi:hypothetical protein
MLELLEELKPGAKKVFQKHVHMNELTALSINGDQGQALALTNHYLYLIFKGLFQGRCQKISPRELTGVDVRGATLEVQVAGAVTPVLLHFPPDKAGLLPQVAERLQAWQQQKT